MRLWKKLVLPLTLLGLLSSGVAYASIPDSTTHVYTACVKTTPGFLEGDMHKTYMIDKQSGESCSSGYSEKTWSQAKTEISFYVVSNTTNGPVSVANCHEGDVVTGGGVSGGGAFGTPGAGLVILGSAPRSSAADSVYDGWSVSGVSNASNNTAYAVCVHVN